MVHWRGWVAAGLLLAGCQGAGPSARQMAQQRAEVIARDATLQRFVEKQHMLQAQRQAMTNIYGADSAAVRAIDWELVVCDRFIATRRRQLESSPPSPAGETPQEALKNQKENTHTP